jgi:hypothetical protein
MVVAGVSVQHQEQPQAALVHPRQARLAAYYMLVVVVAHKPPLVRSLRLLAAGAALVAHTAQVTMASVVLQTPGQMAVLAAQGLAERLDEGKLTLHR